MNSFGQFTQVGYGNTLTTTKTFDCLGLLRTIKTGAVQNLSYSFNSESGNLISRRDNIRSLQEIFTYDNLDRLTQVTGPASMTMTYSSNGNMASKTMVGDYSYGTRPHAVTGVTNPNGLIPTTDQRITYTSFNKVDSIIEGTALYTLQYGFTNERTLSKSYTNGAWQKKTYYVGNYEMDSVAGSIYPKHIHYIYGGDGIAAIYTIEYSTTNMYYVHSDHLGSIDVMTNQSGIAVQYMSFDAWGRRRNPADWTYNNVPTSYLVSRGYTMHEHLDQFGLINMNGRVYDPVLGRFLGPDPFIQKPTNTQSYNRFSFVINNPLKFKDPSGEVFILDDWIIGFFKGIGTKEGAWKSAKRHAKNSLHIWQGLFTVDTRNSGWGWQLLSKFTWQLPQTVVGLVGAHGINMFGQVENVDINYGATVVAGRKMNDKGAFTIGSFI